MKNNKKYFKTTAYSVSNTIKPGQKNVKVEWLFEDLKKEDIAKDDKGNYAIRPGCGCTANVEVLDDRIVAYYTDGTSKKDVQLSVNKEKIIGKTIRVFFDDGQPLYTKNDRGTLMPNVSSKDNISLSFNVTVQV